ncbi:MAG: Hpt domain-containing protein, partial [Gammaproteobacteria bacterium]|nr:Hpt domain-containing protein [Gammaproteobacteria bacterium]
MDNLNHFIEDSLALLTTLDARMQKIGKLLREGKSISGDYYHELFRGFHTLKSSAGFLDLDALVFISHKSEDLLDLIRQGDFKMDLATANLLQEALDYVGSQFERLSTGQSVEQASLGLLQKLNELVMPR